MKKIYEMFMGGRYSNISHNSNKLVIFISKLCNKLSLEIDINDYELSKEEYEQKLIKYIRDYYIEKDKNRQKKKTRIFNPRLLF